MSDYYVEPRPINAYELAEQVRNSMDYSIYLVVEVNDDWICIPLMTTILVCVGAIIGLLLAALFRTPTKYETQYKVTISDEVSMNDFLEKYEIIETEGKIYTVREKGE